MPDLSENATCPPHTRAVDFGHVLVLVNYATGRVQCLPPAAAARWRAAARTGDLTALGTVLTHQLLGLGVLTPTDRAVPWAAPVTAAAARASWGGAEHPAGMVRPPRVPLRSSVRAGTALARVTAVSRRPHGMERVITLLSRATRRARRPATGQEAEAIIRAVRRAGWYSPARTACLEESAAAVLLLAARGRRVLWCHGVAPDPVRLHAWVQTVDGAIVGEPESTGAYTPVLTIGDHHQHRA
ncbi:lasso peptide biosynthesis B2 protein [Streptomyces xiamenensis]|uniref:lasso peptide biosynthesis B2 protein n=1 Tax=Streptomyces xiamenensis TaxID=408015 RepID=UPI0036E41D40